LTLVLNGVPNFSPEAPVAQLDRASDYGSEGLKFESSRVHLLDSQGVKYSIGSKIQLQGFMCLDTSWTHFGIGNIGFCGVSMPCGSPQLRKKIVEMDLNVPFEEKDEAKKLGARWDKERRTWYMLPGLDLKDFDRWIPKQKDFNVTSPSYFVAQSYERCWKCGQPNRVIGFLLTDGYQEKEDDMWTECGWSAFVYYVESLVDDVAKHAQLVSANYRLDFSNTTRNSYWMNHCDFCGSKLGDHPLYAEVDAAFSPSDSENAKVIKLYPGSGEFIGCCQGSLVGGSVDLVTSCAKVVRVRVSHCE
jgi:hypothetical protein